MNNYMFEEFLDAGDFCCVPFGSHRPNARWLFKVPDRLKLADDVEKFALAIHRINIIPQIYIPEQPC